MSQALMDYFANRIAQSDRNIVRATYDIANCKALYNDEGAKDAERKLSDLRKKKLYFEQKLAALASSMDSAIARQERCMRIVAKLQTWLDQLESEVKNPKTQPAQRHFIESSIKRIKGILADQSQTPGQAPASK